MKESIEQKIKESDDEKIRTNLIVFFKREFGEHSNAYFAGIKVKDIIVWLEKECEQKSVDKVEPKFKVGDIMRTLQEAKDGLTDGMPFVVSIDSEYYNCNSEKITIKVQDEYEYPPMNRKYDVCDSIDKQKPTWSEDDKKCLENAIIYCEWARDKAPDLYCYETSEKSINWLKSLRPQNRWKPTEGQMKSLKEACDEHWEPDGLDPLYTLYQDLKKLREE